MINENLNTAFYPRSIAVVGASGNPSSRGYGFTTHLLDYGYKGQIYPVNMNWPEILGLKAYPSLREIPGTVDYVICCLPAPKVPDLLSECPEKGVKVVHLFTARFSETGSKDASRLEAGILEQARQLGIRLIGPNCLGIYHPAQGIGFAYDFPTEPGNVGMLSQSGGAATEFIHYASLRGVRFSKVVSYGNALDLNESDFMEYLTEDPETGVIACYIEGVKDGRKFFDTLRRTARSKPVIILKSGRGSAGARSASSHTGAMAGSQRVWETAIRQAGAIQAKNMKEMMGLVAAFSFLPPVEGIKVGIFGGGGGTGVLSADSWEEAGFNVAPLPPEIEQEIRKTMPELWWGWIRNPVDGSIIPEQAKEDNLAGKISHMMARSPYFDLIAANISVGGPASGTDLAANTRREVENIIDIKNSTNKPLVAVLNTGTLGIENFDYPRWKCLAERKAELTEAGVPVYPTPEEAAAAIFKLAGYYQKRDAID